MKYREDENMQKALEYVKSTYGQHYVGNDPDETQILDLLRSGGLVSAFCQSNAMKYSARFGKKSPAGSPEARKDLYKAIHYCLLLLHFTDEEERKNK